MLYLTILVLICLSGLFSGLTLGFLGLDASELKRKADLGDQRAKKIYSVRKNGNLLLCTLLIGNVAVNSAISIVLSDITSGVLAGVLATFLIVVFGEIFPQATFYRYAMKIGHYTVWLVKFFIFIFYPVCWPLSKILDKILGQEIPKVWSRAELREIIKYHEDSSLSDINSDEERIMLGALSYSQKKVAHVMTPRALVFALELNTVLNQKKLSQIAKIGFSRIPVFKKNVNNIKGILYTKDLALMKKNTRVKDIYQKNNFLVISKTRPINKILNKFFKKRLHLAIVVNKTGRFEGVITLEDIIEEIFKIEILDEKDVLFNSPQSHRKTRKKLKKISQNMLQQSAPLE